MKVLTRGPLVRTRMSKQCAYATDALFVASSRVATFHGSVFSVGGCILSLAHLHSHVHTQAPQWHVVPHSRLSNLWRMDDYRMNWRNELSSRSAEWNSSTGCVLSWGGGGSRGWHPDAEHVSTRLRHRNTGFVKNRGGGGHVLWTLVWEFGY